MLLIDRRSSTNFHIINNIVHSVSNIDIYTSSTTIFITRNSGHSYTGVYIRFVCYCTQAIIYDYKTY